MLLGWRDVPSDNSSLGETVKPTEPVHMQVFIGRNGAAKNEDDFERRLYILRKSISQAIYQRRDRGLAGYYPVSLSCRTVVYKGMFLADQLGKYYPDLSEPDFESALALVHQRFSTNTFPAWSLAHPYRMIAHNGEINTLRGNVNWMAARQASVHSELYGKDISRLWPISYEGQSDTACFDNGLEFLVQGGYSLPHAVMMMIPEAWAGNPLMDEERRAFYEYHAAIMEPWDGPAAIAFTDGRQIGATLDRNGLRPARYLVTSDDRIIMASEMGVLKIPEESIITKWRLQPGKMLLVDLEQGRLIPDDEIKAQLAKSHPYREWLDRTQIVLEELPDAPTKGMRSNLPLLDRQQAFGYSAGRHHHPDDADGLDRRGSQRLDGQRHADLGAVGQAEAAVHLLQAELRAGHQPADRSDPRRAGDEPGLDHRSAAEPVRPAGPGRHQAARSAPADPDRRRPGKDPLDLRGRRQPFQVAHARHHLPRRPRRGRPRAGARRTLRARRSRGPRRHQHRHPERPRCGKRPDSDPLAAGLRRRASSPDPHRPAHVGRPRGRIRRTARGASLRLPRRLRRRSDQSLSRVRDHHRDEGQSAGGARRLRNRQALHQVDRQGPAQGDVEDGHLDLSVLLRRADLRRRRAEGGFRREVFRRHPYPHRRRRPGRNRRGNHAPPCRRVRRRARVQDRARCRRRICLPHPRRGSRLDRRIGLDAAACRARQFAGALPGVRENPQRAVRTAADAARPVQDQDRRGREAQAGAARRGRAGQGHRQAFCHRRDVVRLDLARGAHHAGDRHEPDRRQVQHRRRRRGERSLQADAERQFDALGDQAGRLRPLRRHDGISRQRRHDADQDGAGRQARRRRPVARPQGRRDDRPGAAFDARRRPDLAAAASRHLFDRGSGAADLRPQERQSRRPGLGQARLRNRRRHRRRRRRQGARRPCHHRRLRGRHRRVAADLDQARRHAPGKSGSPKPTRRWCASGCAAASWCRSTAASAPDATS